MHRAKVDVGLAVGPVVVVASSSGSHRVEVVLLPLLPLILVLVMPTVVIRVVMPGLAMSRKVMPGVAMPGLLALSLVVPGVVVPGVVMTGVPLAAVPLVRPLPHRVEVVSPFIIFAVFILISLMATEPILKMPSAPAMLRRHMNVRVAVGIGVVAVVMMARPWRWHTVGTMVHSAGWLRAPAGWEHTIRGVTILPISSAMVLAGWQRAATRRKHTVWGVTILPGRSAGVSAGRPATLRNAARRPTANRQTLLVCCTL